MDRERLDIARRCLDAFNGRSADAFVDTWDPDAEFFTLTGTELGRDPFAGHAGIRRYWQERSEVWAELRIEADELREVGERVVMTGRLVGRGRLSGASVAHELGLVFELRGERVVRVRSYVSGAEGLSAAAAAE